MEAVSTRLMNRMKAVNKHVRRPFTEFTMNSWGINNPLTHGFYALARTSGKARFGNVPATSMIAGSQAAVAIPEHICRVTGPQVLAGD
jgi:hypothetical protein